MPVHNWTCVEAGIFHDFHHAWIEELKRALNGGILPGDYYALAQRVGESAVSCPPFRTWTTVFDQVPAALHHPLRRFGKVGQRDPGDQTNVPCL